MKCYNHPTIDVVGLCKKCLKGICRECSTEIDGGIVCRDSCSGVDRGKGKTIATSLTIIFFIIGLFAIYYVMNTKRLESEEARKIDKATSLARIGADQIQKAMLAAIASGELKGEQFFDVNYVPIPGTDPPKYHTSYDLFFDRNIQPILDHLMTETYVVYAVASDRNGYLPTHISKFTQPLTGDLQTDRVNNRSKRIFNDPIGLAASKNTGAPLVQRYMRDTGEKMADCAIPITINGKHWGAMRVGVTFGGK